MATKYHGKNAQIEIGLGSPLTLVCAFASWDATFDREFTEASTFCDEDIDEFPGAERPAGTLTGFMTKEDASLLDSAAAATTSPYTLRITPTTLEPGVYFEGPFRGSVAYGGAYNGMVTVTLNWRGAGTWTRNWGFTSP